MISFWVITRKNCQQKYGIYRFVFKRIEYFCISLYIDSRADKDFAGSMDFEKENVCVCVCWKRNSLSYVCKKYILDNKNTATKQKYPAFHCHHITLSTYIT